MSVTWFEAVVNEYQEHKDEGSGMTDWVGIALVAKRDKNPEEEFVSPPRSSGVYTGERGMRFTSDNPEMFDRFKLGLEVRVSITAPDFEAAPILPTHLDPLGQRRRR